MEHYHNSRHYHVPKPSYWRKRHFPIRDTSHRQRWIAALTHHDESIPFISVFYRIKTRGTIRPGAKVTIQLYVFISLHYGQTIYQVDSHPLYKVNGKVISFKYTDVPNVAIVMLDISSTLPTANLPLDGLEAHKINPSIFEDVMMSTIDRQTSKVEFDFDIKNNRADDFKGCVIAFYNATMTSSAPQPIPPALKIT